MQRKSHTEQLMVLSVSSSDGRISTRSLSVRISAIVKLDRLLGSFSRGTKRIGRTFSTRSRQSIITSPTSTPPSPVTPLPMTPDKSSNPATPVTPSSSHPWLASPEVERAAFFMYLGQLKAQISVLNTAVERLEQHLGKVTSGLAVLGGMGRAEIRARLVLVQRGLIADSELEDAVVREWLRDLDREVAEGEEEEGDSNAGGDGGGGGSAWEERVQWEKQVFLDSVMAGFEWVGGRLRKVEDGVKAAEVKLVKLVERRVVEEVLFPRLDWGGIVIGQGGEELGGKTPSVTVMECRGDMERLGIRIEALRNRYLMGASSGGFERSRG